MKLKKIFIVSIILIILTICFSRMSSAEEMATPLEVTTMETPNFVRTDSIDKMSEITVSNNEITMYVKQGLRDTEDVPIDEMTGKLTGLYSELYYSYNENLEELKKINLKQYFINKGINLYNSFIKIKNIYILNNIFYVDITIEYEDGNTYKKSNMMLEINNEINISEVIFPNNSSELILVDNNNQKHTILDAHHCVYDGKFILTWEGFEGVYYITKDFKNWEEMKLPEETRDYVLVNVTEFEDGVNFVFCCLNEKTYYDMNGNYPVYSYATSDFSNYKKISENYLSSKWAKQGCGELSNAFYNSGWICGVCEPVWSCENGPKFYFSIGYKKSCFEEWKEISCFRNWSRTACG